MRGFAQVPNLGVNRTLEGWREVWSNRIGLPPMQTYATLSKGLPDTTKVYIDLADSEFTIRSDLPDRTRVLEFDGKLDLGTAKTLRLKEIRVHEEHRGKGIGTQAFENLVAFAGMIGLQQINLRAGRENGPVFWTKRGLKIETDGQLAEVFSNGVRSAFENLPDTQQAEYADDLERALECIDEKTHQRVLQIGAAQTGTTEVGEALLSETEPRMFMEIG